MNCYLLNEEIYKKIESKLDNPKPAECGLDENYFKSIYSPGTLINDWFERRVGKNPETEKSEPPLSETMDEYRDLCKYSVPDRQNYFNKIFENYGLGQELLTDHSGLSYYDNYTTTTDLIYNHLTKGICGPLPRRYSRGVYKPETDLTNIFGNLTQWGLKEKIYKIIENSQKVCKDQNVKSETKDEFTKHNMQAVKKLNDFPSFKRVKVVY